MPRDIIQKFYFILWEFAKRVDITVINFLRFVLNREILMFRQTFLESTLKFAEKMSVVK